MIEALKYHGMFIEIRRVASRTELTCTGIVKVEEFVDDLVTLAAHGGRLKISGKALSISVFDGRAVKVFGKITGVQLL